MLHLSQVFEHGQSFLTKLFEMGWSKTRYFLELGGKVSHTAIMHEVGNFCK